MGRAVDLFVTYRFIKLLVTPFEKTEAFQLGIIDKDGNRVITPKPKTGPWLLALTESVMVRLAAESSISSFSEAEVFDHMGLINELS